MSGIWFLAYKYFVSKRTSIGIFAGAEQEAGDWGVPQWNTDIPLPLGTFSRRAYTIASEVSFEYYKEENTRVFSTFGAGITTERETDVLQQANYHNAQVWLGYTTSLTGSETKIPKDAL